MAMSTQNPYFRDKLTRRSEVSTLYSEIAHSMLPIVRDVVHDRLTFVVQHLGLHGCANLQKTGS